MLWYINYQHPESQIRNFSIPYEGEDASVWEHLDQCLLLSYEYYGRVVQFVMDNVLLNGMERKTLVERSEILEKTIDFIIINCIKGFKLNRDRIRCNIKIEQNDKLLFDSHGLFCRAYYLERHVFNSLITRLDFSQKIKLIVYFDACTSYVMEDGGDVRGFPGQSIIYRFAIKQDYELYAHGAYCIEVKNIMIDIAMEDFKKQLVHMDIIDYSIQRCRKDWELDDDVEFAVSVQQRPKIPEYRTYVGKSIELNGSKVVYTSKLDPNLPFNMKLECRNPPLLDSEPESESPPESDPESESAE